ncbi:Acetylornithine deacetylase/Succinyl-diaminopimelate desuccinylase [Faunimonas pinastri]|uniref:Acetylornithine deacetylase/Succinyl-diaminopimelate desuccinylase n=1 Tax=Faunimonas pinastri TaxID=1855383 RepID=A0A1H9PVE9_9HYPH|nr:dipeptidase [Faunimonas pinastri]SER52152.1 Acetylornithine deacetylase/Succinyl-diaminopimelate desuccinylase [Faunimonas pinastri]
MADLERVLKRIDEDLDQSLDRLFSLLRIPSISADPTFKADCRRAAEWCAATLSEVGFEASVRDTQGHPMVVGHYTGAGEGAPHVLFYGHYDVQPVDPLDLWETSPFEPSLAEVEGEKRIVGRGSADDKGQLMTFVEAARAWFAETGGLPVNVTVLFEGEEESSSPSMIPFLTANAKELTRDVALVCDTNMWNRKTPAIATMLRGLVYDEVIIQAASRDLHSGLYGSAARNPIHVLTRILADLRDENGHIKIPDFYEGVPELSDEQKASWDRLGFDQAEFLGGVGLSVPAGERDRSVLEQIWSRPTLEVNGIVGGYIGEGAKTVIPAKASAKVSFRLVGEQDPDKIRAAFRAFVTARAPEDCKVTFLSHGGDRAVSQPTDSDFVQKTRKALSDEWNTEAALIAMGGSIPIVTQFKRHLGMDSVLVGFGLDDDRIHSPNEKYNLSSFHGGTRSWARILGELGAGKNLA